MLTIERTQTIVVEECCRCGMAFGMPRAYVDRKRTEGGTFHCPSGHPQRYTTTENARLKADIERLKRQKQSAEDDAKFECEQRRKTERKLSATKGVVTRTKRRIACGVCPCCSRHFRNLQRHMDGQHPSYVGKHQ